MNRIYKHDIRYAIKRNKQLEELLNTRDDVNCELLYKLNENGVISIIYNED